MPKSINKYLIGIVFACIILGVILFLVFSNNTTSNSTTSESVTSNSTASSSTTLNKLSPVTIVKYSDENSSIMITKNNIAKTAKINFEAYGDFEEASSEEEFYFDMSDLAINMGTRLMCGVLSVAFFNETALEEFNKKMQEWNNMEGVIIDEQGKEIGKPEKNPFEGYKVTIVNFALLDKNTRERLGECEITGPTVNDIVLKIDGKVVSFESE